MKKKAKKAILWVSFYIKQEAPNGFKKHQESIEFLGDLSISGDRGVLTSSKERSKLIGWLRSWGFVVEGTDFRGHDAACASYLKDRPKASDGSRMGDLYHQHHMRGAKVTERERKSAANGVLRARKVSEKIQNAAFEAYRAECNRAKDLVSKALEKLVVTFGPGPYELEGRFYLVGSVPKSDRLYLVPQPHLDKKIGKGIEALFE